MSTLFPAPQSRPIAEITGVDFSYDGVRAVLDNISLTLHEGQAYALVGPNGAGKSTIVGLLTGNLEPTHGSIVVGGKSQAAHRRACTATVNQQLSLFPHLTVVENLLLGPTHLPRGARAGASALEVARRLLEAIGADLPLDAMCGSLPFAARQRIEIARALARRPSVLCLDEPTSALDRASKAELYAALGGVRATGTTVLLVTHDPQEVIDVGATPIYISNGRLVEHLEPIAVSANGLSRTEATSGKFGSPFDVRVTNHVRGADSAFSVAPGIVTLALFEDALERSESVQAFLGNNGGIVASIRTDALASWKRLPDRSLSGQVRTVSGSKHEDNVFPSLTTQENAVLLSAVRSRSGIRSARSEQRLLEELRHRAAIEYPSNESRFTALSGGNQQRLILAAAIESRPDLLIAEEPLMGVDERSLESISSLLWNHAENGGRVLVATCFPDTYQRWDAKRIELPGLPLHVIFIVDASGSMGGERIHSLNKAMRGVIPHIRDFARGLTNTEILIRIVQFSTGACWHRSQPTNVEHFDWADLTAHGTTDMGQALLLVAEALAMPPMPTRAIPPVLILVSDGSPTDDFDRGLEALMAQPWGRKAVRLSIALGDDVEESVLKRFAGPSGHEPLRAGRIDQLADHIRWASTTALHEAVENMRGAQDGA